MTPEIVAAVVGLLTGLAGLVGAVTVWIKQRTKIEAAQAEIRHINTSRVETAERRDKDTQELRDTVQKHTWELSQIKDEMKHRDTLLDDLRVQVSTLNTSLAVVSQKIDQLCEAIKELKEQRQ